MEPVDTQTLVGSLLEHEETIPPSLRSDILARGREAVGPLISLLADPELDHKKAPGQGFSPIHAVSLLAELRAPEAIQPMLAALSRTEPGFLLYDSLLAGLESLGPQVTPPALELLSRTGDPEYRERLLSVLARSGVRDERIFDALCEQLRKGDVVLAAMNLADYGDPRAIEPLKQALDAHVMEPEDELFSNQTVIELASLIEELGGSLEPAQQARYEQVLAQRARWRAELLESWGTPRPPRRQELPGRNEPCWCGSGVKYKKCHLSTDPR